MECEKKIKAGVLILILMLIFLAVYTPHFNYKYPLHIDEWHNIEQALKLKQGIIMNGESGLELGFRAFLAFLSFFIDLVSVYKFFPAVWAVFSALVLFYVVRKKTEEIPESFFISVMAMIFFGSIKSSVNLTGLWFFTPLTFCIPFVFLYIYFFTEGIEKENKKMVLLSLLIMVFVLISHAPSLLFSIPFLALYCLLNMEKTKKQYKALLYFLIIPLIGILFYKAIFGISFKELIFPLLDSLTFKLGWGVVELHNSPFEVYSFIGYILAFIGLVYLIYSENVRKHLISLLWAGSVLLYILVFVITGKSFLSPYQRNFYYFALSLPILSSFGAYFIILFIKNLSEKLEIFKSKSLKGLMIFLTVFLMIFLSFYSYSDIPGYLKPYRLIDEEDYNAVKFLSDFPLSRAVAPIEISTTLFSISRQEPVATIHFIGNETEVKDFYRLYDCKDRNNMVEKYEVKYVLSKSSINCNWTEIYDKNDRFVYEINRVSE
jgi:hypothetical protein